MTQTVTIELMSPSSERTAGFVPQGVAQGMGERGEISSVGTLIARGFADTRNPAAALAVRILVWQSLSSKHSWDNYIANRFKDVGPVSAIFRERSEEGLKFYLIVPEENDNQLKSLFDMEQEVYRLFPEEIDFEVLLGQEMEAALPSAAINLWRRVG